ncbi:MAG: phenylalanine--tRNA ligase subunit beta, partial [Acidobacteriota bacterium]|nr:phenylalanine--tRNA ligase subunit beta [Acidobacteriota bacterium]
ITDRVSIEAPDLCYRFTSRIVRGVKVGPSPPWLVERLEAVGERPINNIADITNFVMHELGQPMHAFDLDSLNGRKIVVRRAAKGEKIATLDEEVRDLDPSILAICDTDKPVAIAGVMGGLESGVTESTADVLLEVACFDRDSIRKTSARLNLSTEASYRFERGVDIENLVKASNRAASLMSEIAGGDPQEFSDEFPSKRKAVSVETESLEREFRRLTGIELTDAEIEGYLKGLGFEIRGASSFEVPSWRHDVSIPEDLVEEVARIHGYDRIGEALPPSRSAGEYHHLEQRKRRLRTALVAAGFDEAMSYSFVDGAAASAYSTVDEMRGDETPLVLINDPIIEGANLMRPTLLTGMIEAVHKNFNHRESDLRLFEIGRTFRGLSESSLPEEKEMLAVVLTGRESFENTSAAGRAYDFFDLKAAVETAAEAIGIRGLEFAVATEPRHLQVGQSALVRFRETIVGAVGRLESTLADGYKFKQPVYVAELDLSFLLEEPESVAVYKPLDVYPSVVRDVSLVVTENISLSKILEVVSSAGFENFEKATYVDTYTGEGVEEGERSVTIRFEYRSPERTLTDKEVDQVHSEVLSSLESTFSARFR